MLHVTSGFVRTQNASAGGRFTCGPPTNAAIDLCSLLEHPAAVKADAGRTPRRIAYRERVCGNCSGIDRLEVFRSRRDIGITGRGRSMAEAFEQAALALTAVITSADIRPIERVEVHCQRTTTELLLVEWLDAIIYEMAVRHMLFGRYSVEISGVDLRGEMWGEPVDGRRHAPACEPKGATLTALRVAREDDGLWSAGCVIDV
jgi:tRNA nucleotidyltransferase (CCA-adding enzyme)